MTEKIRESISAFMDDEISEIELHRLLRQFSGDDAEQRLIKESWVSYQQIRTVANGEAGISTADHLALHSRISEAIAEESVETTMPNISRSSSRRWAMPATGFAVAASLVIAVFVGQDLDRGQEQNPGLVSSGAVKSTPALVTQTLDTQAANTQAIDAQRVSTTNNTQPVSNMPSITDAIPNNIAANVVAFDTEGADLELRALDAEKQNRLRDYLNRHERMTKKNPLSRTVVYPTKSSDN